MVIKSIIAKHRIEEEVIIKLRWLNKFKIGKKKYKLVLNHEMKTSFLKVKEGNSIFYYVDTGSFCIYYKQWEHGIINILGDLAYCWEDVYLE